MKIFLAQLNYHIGNFELNTKKIINAIEQAKQQGGDLIVFSELCVCGYPPNDLLELNNFIDKSYKSIDTIKLHADTIGVLVGAPAQHYVHEEKVLFNAVFFLHEQKIVSEIHKTLLPAYDVFDECRYFKPANNWQVIALKGKKIAVTIGEDIWQVNNRSMDKLLPMDILMKQQPNVMINLSASPFDYTTIENRKSEIGANVLKYKLPMLYCNAVGSQTELVFDGSSCVFDKHGNLCKQLPAFKEAVECVALNDEGNFNLPTIKSNKNIPNTNAIPAELAVHLHTPQIYEALVMGIKDYFNKMNFTKAIIGSSGGIDSAVTLAVAVEALGKENVLAVLMPSPYSTEHSVNDAVQLSNNLNNPYNIIHINAIYENFLSTLQPLFHDLPFSVAEENMQSRIRGNLLMSIANKFGYILLNTSNKSELATGYGTLYGDMAGGISVLGDLYKTQVYALTNFINRNKEIIPQNIIEKMPSAELRPHQKDSDSLPDYNVLDKILYQYIERKKCADEIKQLGFDGALVDRILQIVNANEYKRHQFCPIIRLSPKAFGAGRRMPMTGK